MTVDLTKIVVVLAVVALVAITAFFGKSLEISPFGGIKFESAPRPAVSFPGNTGR